MTPSRRWLAEAVDASSLAALSREGVRAVALPLHGARAEVHDWVAGPPGAFRATLDALQTARSLQLEVTAWTLLTRSNARVLGELPSLLAARAVVSWIVVVPPLEDDGSARTRVVPRFGLGVPSALAALDAAEKRGLRARILGAPRCTLGRFADRAVPSPARSYAPVCEGCPSRSTCPGVDAAYLARFGDHELRPAPLVAPGAPLAFEGAP
ncbi:MAG: hypothetical protein H6719_10320 [Sandaracinaceae bacterium]|nr:hypothetical protein [Sandaracinaceae bacterium]